MHVTNGFTYQRSDVVILAPQPPGRVWGVPFPKRQVVESRRGLVI